MNLRRAFQGAVILAACVFACIGCQSRSASEPRQAAQSQDIFFPPEPDAPRVQFLQHVTGSTDVEKAPSPFAKFLLGDEAEKPKSIGKPFGVAIFKGRIYVCDTMANNVVVLDLENRTFGKFGQKGPGRLSKPVSIRTDKDGLLYVCDTQRKQVIVFNPDGEYVTAYGKEGDFYPADVAMTPTELYVLDLKEHSIKVYDLKTRELKRTLGKRGNQPGEFNYPTNLVIDGSGNIYVSDSLNFRVQKISPEGKPLLQFGQAGQTPGSFARPKGIAVDNNGIIYVVDSILHVVQLFDQEGRALMHIGEGGEGPGQLALPAQAVIDYNNLDYFRKYISADFDAKYLVIVTNQLGRNKLSIFAFGERKSVQASKSN